MRRLYALLGVEAVLATAQTARAADSLAPPGALANWLPNEQWVYQHYLPYDEARLYRLLGTPRGAVWRYLRDDQAHNLAQLAARRGYSARTFAAVLVAPRAANVSAAKASVLRARAVRTLTQGHLSQHILFHPLHQWALPGRSRSIFGFDYRAFTALRLTDLSPMDVARLVGRDAVDVRRRALAALRAAARRGVRQGDMSSRQAELLFARQAEQLPRWLGQSRDNGPPPVVAPASPILPVADFANHPSISADGSRVAWDAYRAKIPDARRRGEIRVVVANLRTGLRAEASRTLPRRAGVPRSAYNSMLSADGRSVVFETSEGNLNFGKRYGAMRVVLNDIAGQVAFGVSGARPSPGTAPGSAYNPSISGNGRRVVFESAERGGASGENPQALWLFDRGGRARLLARGGLGATFEPRVSADGNWVVYADTPTAAAGRVEVFATSLLTGANVLVSRASGAAGAAADGDATEPSPSADGRIVAFTSSAGNLGAAGRRSRVYVRDLERNTTETVSPRSGWFAFDPAVSADGRFVVYAARPVDGGGRPSFDRAAVWRYDRITGRTLLVSRLSATDHRMADGVSTQPVISADGGVLAFTSTARNLDRAKPAGVPGVFLFDARTGRTTLLSTHASRTGAAGRPATAEARIARLCHLGG